MTVCISFLFILCSQAEDTNVDVNARMRSSVLRCSCSCAVCAKALGYQHHPLKQRQSRRGATLSDDREFLSERSTSTPSSVAGQVNRNKQVILWSTIWLSTSDSSRNILADSNLFFLLPLPFFVSSAHYCLLLLQCQNRAVANLVNKRKDKGSNAIDSTHWLADKAKARKRANEKKIK